MFQPSLQKSHSAWLSTGHSSSLNEPLQPNKCNLLVSLGQLYTILAPALQSTATVQTSQPLPPEGLMYYPSELHVGDGGGSGRPEENQSATGISLFHFK